jgi:hypothetical protein
LSASRPAGAGGGLARALVAVLVGVGLLSRVAPLFDQGGRLLRQFPTEDGYLMLTIARNIALGLGMSTAEGTLPTNGTQPLATLLWATCFWLVGGSKTAGVALVLVLELVIACAGAWLLYRLGRQVFAERSWGPLAAAFAAALWFASPTTTVHSMNALETGLYALLIVAVLSALVRGRAPGASAPSWGAWMGIGVLLGLAFWGRNDAVLLCAVLGVIHLAGGLRGWPGTLGQRFAELAAAGVVAGLVAAPWLLHNLLRFGHAVPVSGQAQSLSAGFAENLALVPPKLFEYLAPLLPLPNVVETWPLVIAACTLLAVGVAVALLVGARAMHDAERALLWLGGGLTVALAAFYGLSFGAGHFMSRYLFAASPALALLVGAVAALAWQAAGARGITGLRTAAAGVAILLAVGLHARLYVNGNQHEHFQVVEWVQENVPEELWVGAIQTGTLGFFHDRTINLDGKVNPEALAARQAGGVASYVVARRIPYLVDWMGIAEWAERPGFAPYYELLLLDPKRNLAVLRHRDLVPGDAVQVTPAPPAADPRAGAPAPRS